jgi:hypothetical protein
VHDDHALDPVIERGGIRRLRRHLLRRQSQRGRIGGKVVFAGEHLRREGQIVLLDGI